MTDDKKESPSEVVEAKAWLPSTADKALIALLKFLGLGENIQLSTLLDPFNAGMPPLLFITSIIAFIISYTPYVGAKRFVWIVLSQYILTEGSLY